MDDSSDFVTWQEIDALASEPADHRLLYGSEPSQFLDLRIPKGDGPHPVVIVIHGGCWSRRFSTLQNTAAMADALRNEGYATANFEYRRADEDGGGWPGTYLDVADAADILAHMAAQFDLDATRVVASGHSAGGHLALWLAARPKLPLDSPLYREKPLTLLGVAATAAPGDLAAARNPMTDPCEQDMISLLMGGAPDQVPGRYQQGSPVELLPLGVPQLLITGQHDPVVPVRLGDDYVARATAAGDRAEHRVVEEAAHHECNLPGSVIWPYLLANIQGLFSPQKSRE